MDNCSNTRRVCDKSEYSEKYNNSDQKVEQNASANQENDSTMFNFKGYEN